MTPQHAAELLPIITAYKITHDNRTWTPVGVEVIE